MDYKDKLRLAKEALDSGSYDKETIEYIFPELAESEDEKIRKELIEFVKNRGGFKQEYIAWLEKQGEQKPTEWSEKTKGLDELETYILSIVPNRPLDAIKVDSKNIRFLINKEQKPAWSEEDEYHKRQILRILKDNGCSQTLQERTEKWIEERLKSLRPQNAWKPTEEQMDALDYYANSLCTYCDRQDDLRSLFNVLKKLTE